MGNLSAARGGRIMWREKMPTARRFTAGLVFLALAVGLLWRSATAEHTASLVVPVFCAFAAVILVMTGISFMIGAGEEITTAHREPAEKPL
jgi:hypothetical protein